MFGDSPDKDKSMLEINIEDQEENKLDKKEESGPYWSKMNNFSQRFDNLMPKVVQVRKNQYDPTAGILYSTGCSLIHLSMFITMFFIKFPDPVEAKK